MTVLHFWEVIGCCPFLWVTFDFYADFASLESLETCCIVGKVLDPHGIEIVPSLIVWQILAPIIRVTFINDAATGNDVLDHVWARPRRHVDTGLIQTRTRLFVPFLGPDRYAAHLINQAAATDSVGKVKLDPVIIQHFCIGYACTHRIGIGFQAVIQKQIVAEQDIMCSDW